MPVAAETGWLPQPVEGEAENSKDIEIKELLNIIEVSYLLKT